MRRLQWSRYAKPQLWPSSSTRAVSSWSSRPSGAAIEWPQLRRRQQQETMTTEGDGTIDDENTEARTANKASSDTGNNNKRRGPPRRTAATSTSWVTSRDEVDWTALAAGADKIRRGESGRGSVRKSSPDTSRTMLLIHGLGDNVSPTDFYRLAPKFLSGWDSTITKVQQQRHPSTLEPTGCYQVSFSNATAAAAYHANLHRIQRLARYKLSSPTGLWKSTVPPHLLVSGAAPGHPDHDYDNDVAALTLASPSQPDLIIHRRRVSLPYPWSRRLSKLVEPLGYGTRPPVVVVDLRPGAVTPGGLAHFIRQDGWERDLAWRVSRPVRVSTPRTAADKPPGQGAGEAEAEAEEDADAQELGADQAAAAAAEASRFVVACETEWEARRFHRQWNGRLLSHVDHGQVMYRSQVTTSLIQW
ncbi:hypothetical protein GMORB2_0298 [Geosmithia morbida]|uniref:Uncharacterized protein n=1 Tax=Geosmithia morbida TaxID=1094350 RepID=A0A9P4Z338_9HYPO|nr:uncharacterized protein GMORB2_0298 [Geosmithia morbida]KAF4126562.1 hypothetical protein GMORB2_0298 [Geosmithia morbida]